MIGVSPQAIEVGGETRQLGRVIRDKVSTTTSIGEGVLGKASGHAIQANLLLLLVLLVWLLLRGKRGGGKEVGVGGEEVFGSEGR